MRYEQAKKNYVTKTKQSIAKAQAAELDLLKERQRLELYQTTMQDFTIVAPADGMVIYAREWDGKKKVVGSTVSSWDPIVATLPDLREMESITYISELDIQKIAAKQPVKLKLDADPEQAPDRQCRLGGEHRRTAAQLRFQGLRGAHQGGPFRHHAASGHDHVE